MLIVLQVFENGHWPVRHADLDHRTSPWVVDNHHSNRAIFVAYIL